MTSPPMEQRYRSKEEIVTEVTGKAAEIIAEAISLLKQTRSYIESRIMAAALPFMVVSHLDPKGLKLYIELVPRPEFFEIVEEEEKKRRKVKTEEPQQETGNTSHESSH